MITINPDQTLAFKPRQKGRSCLTELSEQRGVGLVNHLDAMEMVVAFVLARNGRTAFPLGGGAGIYAALLEKIRAEYALRKAGTPPVPSSLTDAVWALLDVPEIGALRVMIVQDIGSSFNGPLDSYLEVACVHKGALQSTGRGY